MRFPIIPIVLLLFFADLRLLGAQDCAPLDPRQQISERIAQDITGSAQTVFKVGRVEGSYKGVTEKEVKNLYDKYPGADKIVLKDKLIYLFCTTLQGSGMDPSKRIEELNKFILVIQEQSSTDPLPSKQINISGIWRDNWGNMSQFTQNGESFQFTSWGSACQGNYQSSGSGTIRENYVESTYQSTYSVGRCSGTVSPDGRKITSTCSDSVCGSFTVFTERQ